MAGRSDHARPAWWVALAAALVAAVPSSGAAQLLSPGRLAESHAELEGLRSCTSCHELGRRGVAPERCLACHEPLAARMRAGTGLHAASADRNCADCHKDHFGRDFALVRFDTASFRHAADVGYGLNGAHAELACGDCHRADLVAAADVRQYEREHGSPGRTLLGLGTACAACHREDDPHRGQFADETCDACHSEEAWAPAAGFDHDRTRYPLTGLHRRVSCEGCHAGTASGAPARYTGLSFDACTSCHRDVHRGAMGARCESCHATSGWGEVQRSGFERRFEHARTGFTLEGAHADAACASCHTARPGDPAFRMRFAAGARGRAYPRIVVDGCASCHADAHDGAFAARPGGACDECHGQGAWFPTSYDATRHNRDAAFALTGAHAAVPCDACHLDVEPARAGWIFRREAEACRTCHAADDPHDGQFAAADCASCHDTESFRVDAFDHARTRFPLDGAHEGAPCASCHRPADTSDGRHVTRYRPLGTACADCHTEKP